MPFVDDMRRLRDLKGSVWEPCDEGYQRSRAIWNMRNAADRPNCIVQAQDPADVAAVMRYCHETGTPVAVRAGGHGVDGSAMPDGALVIDLTAFKSIDYDPVTAHVRVGAGVLLGEIDKAMEFHSRVVPAGTVSDTGLSGLVLGGGIGFNSRKYGASVDNLLSCDIVATDGRLLRASPTENEDLFWAIRGGGGNFGVVTSFEFASKPLPAEISAAFICFPFDAASDLLLALRDFMTSAPRELTVVGALTRCPPFPMVPDAYHATSVLIVTAVYTGPASDAGRVVEQLSAIGTPIAVMPMTAPWSTINSMLDLTAPPGRSFFTRGGYLTDLTKPLIDIAVENAARAPAPTHYPHPSTGQSFISFGGALTSDFTEDSAAFSRAGANWLWEVVAQWDEASDSEAHETWVDEALSGMAPYLRSNGYINLTVDQGPNWRRKIWGAPVKYERLVAAKTKWDPQNLLRFNKNIPPLDF
jgi:FAD/FMN-containing dehydrogenase